jgi:hypothetical protein
MERSWILELATASVGWFGTSRLGDYERFWIGRKADSLVVYK